jgi:hypothetical protein
MKSFIFKHENVQPDGTFTDKPGKIVTEGEITIASPDDGGEPGIYSATIIRPRTNDGIVEGINIYFTDKPEMDEFMKVTNWFMKTVMSAIE